jgi:uncharacterized protein (DUF1778 family)
MDRMETARRSARLEARITPDLQVLLRRAAELQGRTVSDFVVSAVQEAAVRTIEQVEILRLSVEDQERFAQALLDPPAPVEALDRAFQRRRELLRTL